MDYSKFHQLTSQSTNPPSRRFQRPLSGMWGGRGREDYMTNESPRVFGSLLELYFSDNVPSISIV